MPARTRSAATAALVTLALGGAARAQDGSVFTLAGPPDQPVEIEADRMTYAWEPQVLHLEGHVVARRGTGILRAASGELDRARGILTLKGGVLGVQGKDVLLADGAAIDLNAKSADLKNAVLYLKERNANPDAPTLGKNSLILHGERIRRTTEGYIAEEARMTPCDCAGSPDYELLAHEAHIHGDRADLSGARLDFLGATIPLFPLKMPLTNRQWGLLAPEFGFGGPYWFTYAQPVYFPLGQSYDMTVTPGWYTGGTKHGTVQNDRAIAGLRLGVEWRYAPVEGTTGAIKVDLYRDGDAKDSPGYDPAYPGERATAPGRGFGGGWRGVAHMIHRTEASGVVFAIESNVTTDTLAAADPYTYALSNLQEMLRTDVGLWSARGPLTLGADAALMQDLRIENAQYPDRRLFGYERRPTTQRLPGAFVQLAPMPFGPATFELEAGAVQFERFSSAGGLEVDKGFGLTDRGASVALPLGYDGSRAPAVRLDLSPRLRWSGPDSQPVDLRAEIGGRVDRWLIEGRSELDRTRAYALAGVSAGLPLERRFGTLLHRIEPEVAVRALSRPLQSGGPPIGDTTDAGGPTFSSAPDAAQQGLAPDGATIHGVPAVRRAYDEIDFAAPVSGAVEATLGLGQSLWTKAGRGAARLVRFDLTQDLLLWTHGGTARIGEMGATAAAQIGPVGAGAGVRYDWSLGDISVVSASLNGHDGRSDEVHGTLLMLRGNSSERLRGGIDELFSAARFAVTPTTLGGNAVIGASAPLPRSGLRAGYNLLWTLGDTPPNQANLTHQGTLTFESACKCAGLVVLVSYPFHDTTYLHEHWYLPDFSVRIDLKSLGSFGTF
jgi:LPS-assembly protein